MAYYKMTCVSGKTAAGVRKTTVRSGHWKLKSIEGLIERMALVDKIEAEHSVADMSGKGRGGVDRNFVVVDGVLQEAPLTPSQIEKNEIGDAEEVNEVYDACELDY